MGGREKEEGRREWAGEVLLHFMTAKASVDFGHFFTTLVLKMTSVGPYLSIENEIACMSNIMLVIKIKEGENLQPYDL